MRYSNEFKRKCVELYYQGKYPDTPVGIEQNRFRRMIREWVRIEESCGTNALQHQNYNKVNILFLLLTIRTNVRYNINGCY